MARDIRFRPGLHGLFQAAALALALSACSLAPEQLSLPGSILGSPLGNGGSSPSQAEFQNPPADKRSDREPHIHEGTGQFTGAVPQDTRDRAIARIGDEGVSLSLAGASVTEAAKTILGDILKLNYTVSDKVKAAITLNTAQPVAKEELLAILEVVLRSEGIAISVENEVYNIVPADSAGGLGGRTQWASPDSRQRAGVATAVVPLRYVSAEEMERVLRSIAPRASILRVDTARNLLLVSGTANELDSINATVETFDVDWMRGMSFALLPVESADPEVIAKELDTVFANDTESPIKGVIRFVPNTRLRSVLVISSRPEYLRRATNWLRRIDLAGQATEKQVHVYRVQNRPAAELAVLLRKVYASQTDSGSGLTISTQPQEGASLLSSGDTETGTSAARIVQV